MMRLPRIDDALVVGHFDSVTLARGRRYAQDDRVLNVRWDPQANALTGVVQGTADAPYRCMVLFHPSATRPQILAATCSCPMRGDCKHVAAVLIMATRMDSDDAHDASSLWRSRLADVLARDRRTLAARSDEHPLGLQFRVSPPTPSSRAHVGDAHSKLEVRPVVLGKKGRWVLGGVNWQNLGYSHEAGTRQQRVLLRQLAGLHAIDFPYSGNGSWLQLERVNAPLLWTVLREIAAGGIALVNDDREQTPVIIVDAEASAGIDIVDHDGELAMSVPVVLEGQQCDPRRLGFIGHPATGIFMWAESLQGMPSAIRLARLTTSLDEALARLATQTDVVIPPDAVNEFTGDVLPLLRAQHDITSSDGSFTLPDLPRPVIELHIQHFGQARAEVSWAWRYVRADQEPTEAPRVGLWSERSRDLEAWRDAGEEQRILASLDWLITDFPHLGVPTAKGHRLASIGVLTGMPMLSFVLNALPRLQADGQVVVTTGGDVMNYRAADALPQIAVAANERPGNRDWLDLAITVTVDDEAVPFDELFRALAADEEILVLASGTYVRLDIPELARLRSLIEEARSLQEHARDGLGISRYHVDLWAELEQIGVVDVQAAAWREALRSLTDADRIPARALPSIVQATLRPYQHDGYSWLSHLRDHDLGGILADDMGLGKTLQVIALVAEERARSTMPSPPWLVVAPASVVHNWAAELQRFAPTLRVVTLQQTTAKRATALASEMRDADVVVVSYAIFRLDFDEFDKHEFRGLVLDEAQFVKNHQSKAYGCARRLRASFKVAVTGTPMENNLMELWSLLSITAPGLFPSPKRFAEYYQRPIERDGDDERLALLRRRIAPFMLRRTKEDVAADLPPKQEQVLELDLHPRHRKIYDMQLQRERQRVLGLLDEMDANRFQIFQSLTLLRQLSLDASLVDEKNVGIPSAKLDALMEMLEDVIAEGHRVLVFSQFTRYLALARERLDGAGIRYAYLDGRTRKRADAIEHFRSGSAPVFLISLKAGGFGLNLTEADYVVLLDPWWNPATEAQAVDRAHRIGQERAVMVYRLVSRDTIEEKVMALKAEKAALFEGVMGDSAAGGVGLTAEDIRDLLA